MVYVSVAIGLGLFYSILMWYYTIGWQQLPVTSIPSEFEPVTSVSVIVSVRNEEANIESLISCVLNLHYPKHLLELIIIDDESTDNTVLLIKKHLSDRIHLLQLKPEEKTIAYKKQAIVKGIAASKGNLIVTTDADCIFGKDWIRSLVSYQQTTNASFISAPVCMDASANMFEQFQALEFAGLVGVGAGAMSNKHPNMCNGANVAYLKSAFFEVGGFEGNETIASGDDEFLMHKMFVRYPDKVFFLKNAAAIVTTKPCRTFKEFLNQRMRWVSKSTKYENKNITRILIACYLFNLSLAVSFVLMFLNPEYYWIFLSQVAFKISGEGILLMLVTKFLGIQRFMRWLLPEQLIHIIYVLVIGILGNTKSYQWKGRKS